MKNFFVKYLPVDGPITSANQSYFNDDGKLCHVSTTAQLKGQKEPIRAILHLCTRNISKNDMVFDVRNVATDHQPYKVLNIEPSGKVALNAVGSPEIEYKAAFNLFKVVVNIESHTYLTDGQEFEYGDVEVFIKNHDHADFFIPYTSDTQRYLKQPGYYVFVYFNTVKKDIPAKLVNQWR